MATVAGHLEGQTQQQPGTAVTPATGQNRQQIFLPFVDGSEMGALGSLLGAALLGVTLWLGLLAYLTRSRPRRHPNRRNNMMQILSNTVDNSVETQTKKWEHSGPPPPKDLPPRHRKPHPPHRPYHPPGERSPSRAPQDLRQLQRRNKISRQRPFRLLQGRDSAMTRPLQEDANEGTSHFGIWYKSPFSSDDTAARTPESYSEGDAGADVQRGVKAPVGSDRQSNTRRIQTDHREGPYSLPGSFVTFDRRDKINSDKPYVFEKPIISTPSNFRPMRPSVERQNEEYHISQPNMYLSRRPRPTNRYAESYYSGGSNNRLQSNRGQRTQANIYENQVGPQHYPGSVLDATGDQDHTAVEKDDTSNYFEPPPGLLNPVPNTWRGSGPNQMPSGDTPKLWPSEVTTEQTKDEKDNESAGTEEATTTNPPSTTPPPSNKAPSEDVKSTRSNKKHVKLPSHYNNYLEELFKRQLANGVPINWLPRNVTLSN